MKAFSFRTLMVITLLLLCRSFRSHPLPNASSFPPVFRTTMYKQALQTRSKKPTGVWRITKYSSILGPTVAIFLYQKFRETFERNEPFLSAKLEDLVQRTSAGRPGFNGTNYASLSPDSSFRNSYVMKIANEVVRISNQRLRERAVLSRIQMDDDQYEFSRRASASDVKQTLSRVTEEVLTHGSGRFLKPDEKRAVRRIVRRSVY